MLDETSISRAAALVIRPILSKGATGEEPIRFGGKPRLPADLDWPEDFHHFAEIDFARLPDHVEIEGQAIGLPDRPARGTAFIFLKLQGEGLYDGECVRVLYTDQDVQYLPERTPPASLPSLHDAQNVNHVHKEALSDCGTLLIHQPADAIPILGDQALNPLWTNLADADGSDVSELRARYDRHQAAVAEALHHEPANDPEAAARIRARIPEKILQFNYAFKDRHFDWQFIFDWSKAFYLSCHDMALEHLADMKAAKAQPLLVWFLTRNRAKARATVERVKFGGDRRPFGWVHHGPEDREKAFDVQARAWMTIARTQAGVAPPEMVEAFVQLLEDIVAHYGETDAEGYSLGPRNDVLDVICKGHDWHAGNTLVNAQRAFKTAIQEAATREEAWLKALPREERWRQINLDAAREEAYRRERAREGGSNHCFSLGAMPLQMFGTGFEIQSAVSENADKVLLLQLGDPASGIAVDFGGDGLLQLWIPPKDLAEGRFDRVAATLDYT